MLISHSLSRKIGCNSKNLYVSSDKQNLFIIEKSKKIRKSYVPSDKTIRNFLYKKQKRLAFPILLGDESNNCVVIRGISW